MDHALLQLLLLNPQVHSLSCQLHATVIWTVFGAWPGRIDTARSQALLQWCWVFGIHLLWMFPLFHELLLLPLLLLLWDKSSQGSGRGVNISPLTLHPCSAFCSWPLFPCPPFHHFCHFPLHIFLQILHFLHISCLLLQCKIQEQELLSVTHSGLQATKLLTGLPNLFLNWSLDAPYLFSPHCWPSFCLQCLHPSTQGPCHTLIKLWLPKVPYAKVPV